MLILATAAFWKIVSMLSTSAAVVSSSQYAQLLLMIEDAVVDHLIEYSLKAPAAAGKRRVVHRYIRARRDSHDGIDVEQDLVFS